MVRLKVARSALPSLSKSPPTVTILRVTTLLGGPWLPATSRIRASSEIEPLIRLLGQVDAEGCRWPRRCRWPGLGRWWR